MIMTRLTLLALLLGLYPLVGAAAPLAGSRPNIIFILTDDQGFGQLGCQGHPWLQTPHIDRLQRESVSFSDYQVSPTCSPTRSALLTGNVPFKNGVTHTGGGRERMTLAAVTLPQLLKKAGYTTGIFGKWHLGDEEAYQPESRGFDEAFVHGYGGIGQGMDVPENRYYNPVIRHNGTFVKTKGFCTDVFFSQALGWIKENKDRPFFAYLPTNAAHGPFIPPPGMKEKFGAYGFAEAQAGFYGMIENIDDNVGRLLACLKKWGLDENTLVIFMSDNGVVSTGAGKGKLGVRDGEDLKAFYAGLKGSKGMVHEGGTRVPAFFRWKGTLTEGAVSDALAAHIDLLPTLVELAGAEVPGAIDGKSLVPLLQDPEAPWTERYLCFHRGRWVNEVGPDKSKYDKKAGFAVRHNRYRLVNNEELYDILADRGEEKNIYDQHPEVVTSMMKIYDAWWDEVRPFMVNEGGVTLGPNPFHVDYQEQKKTTGIPDWKEPIL